MAETQLMYPFAIVRGNLGDTGKLYCRMMHGKCIIQHKPNRKNHTPTPAEQANRESFGARYGTARKKS